ncbi:MAG TPA: winged helix-turn-helix domain-containing protein [Solirubrobacteraceae bacterium]
MTAEPDTSTSDAHGLEEFAATIDRDAEVPIGLQLGWALCARIYDGEFRPGQRLPGLRELAQASGLNVNTVRAVYQRLEQRGLLESRQGSGTFVASTLPRPAAIGTIAADAAREAEAIGVDPREVAAALYVAMPHDAPSAAGAPAEAPTSGPATLEAQGDDGTTGGGTAARRRTLRAQIATLERAIAEMEAEHPGVAPRPTATRRGPGPTLLSAHELEGVRSGLVHRLAQVQSAIDARAAGEAGQESTSAADTSSAPSKRPARPRSTARPRPATAGT